MTRSQTGLVVLNSKKYRKLSHQPGFELSKRIEVFYALQYFQEIWRRLSYLSKGESPSISLVETQSSQETKKYPDHNQELVETIFNKISAIWGIKRLVTNDLSARNNLNLSLKEVMLRTSNTKNNFRFNYTISDFSLSSKIKLTSPLFNQLAKEKTDASIM